MVDLFEVGQDGSRNAAIRGNDLLNWRSQINARMRQASVAGDGNLSRNLRDVIGALDDAVVRQAGPEVGRQYEQARALYRLTDALDSGNVVRNGNVRPGTAASVLRRRYPAEFARGNQFGADLPQELQDAFDVTRIANRFGDIVGDSGTATRMSLQNFINHPVATSVTGAASLAGNTIGRRVSGVGTQAAVRGAREQTDQMLGGILARLLGGGARAGYREE
jgi:hypothetical protein